MATVDLTKVAYYVSAILADGSTLNLETVAENIAWEENEKELSVRLNLTLRDVEHGGKRLSQLLALCTVVYLYADWGEGKKEVWRGTIWEWEHSEINDDAIVVTGYDLLYYTQKSSDNKYYEKGKTTKGIIQDIFSTWGLTLGTFNVSNKQHEKTVYKSKAVSAMITETLEEAKKIGGQEAVVRAEQGKVNIITTGSNETIYSFTQDSNILQSKDKYSMTDLVTRVVITGKEDSEGRPKVEATLNGKTQYGILQTLQSLGSSTLDEAKKKAQDTLNEKGDPKRTITLQAPDFPAIRRGDKIHVKTDKLAGYFIVKGVSHNATAMSMTMEVKPAA